MLEYELYINDNSERIVYLRILAAKNFPIRRDIIQNSQIKTQKWRSKNVIKYNRGRPKETKKTRNIKKSNRGMLRNRNHIYQYLNVTATQTLTRNDIRNPEIIIKLNRRIRAYIDS
jgi:hypothetical protein